MKFISLQFTLNYKLGFVLEREDVGVMLVELEVKRLKFTFLSVTKNI